MKKNSSLKKFLILALIFLFVFSIGSSFATDDSNITGDTNAIEDNCAADAIATDDAIIAVDANAIEDNNVVEHIDLKDNSGNAVGDSSKGTLVVLGEGADATESESFFEIDQNKSTIAVWGTRFQDLQDAIDAASDNYTILLRCDLYGNGSQIIVNKSVAIEGNGMKTLDANYSSRIFCILSDNVVLKNLRLINGYQRCYDPNELRPYGHSDNYDYAPVINVAPIDSDSSPNNLIEENGSVKTVLDNGTVIELPETNYSSFMFLDLYDYSVPPLNSTEDNEFGTGPAIKWVGNNGTLIDSLILDNKIDYAFSVGDGKAVSWIGNDGRIKNTYVGLSTYYVYFPLIGYYPGKIAYPGKILDTPVHGTYYGNLESSAFFPDVTLNTLPALKLKNITSYYEEGKKVSFNLNHDDVSFVNETLEVSILSKKCNYTFEVSSDEKGNVKFNLPKNLSAGNYDLIVKFSAGMRNLSSNTTVTINKAPIKVTAPNYTAQYKYGDNYTIKLINSKTNKPFSDKEINLDIYTGKEVKTYTAYTNKKGIADFCHYLSLFSIGKHKVRILVDRNYNLSKKEFTIQITKRKTDIKLSKTSFKYKKSDYLKISLKNKIKKVPLKSLQVKVKIFTGKKSKTYTLKTDKNGMVKINTKGLSKGNHKIQISSSSKLYLISKITSIKVK